VPTITTPDLGNSTTPVVGGRAESGSTVTLEIGDALYTTIADDSGEWRIDTAVTKPESGLLQIGSDGMTTLRVTSQDSAGNISDSQTLSFTLETTAPTLVSTTPVDGSGTHGPSTVLKLTFDEEVAKGSSGSIRLVNDGDSTGS
jgi:hypothetical protein